jgi:hypothetical protein
MDASVQALVHELVTPLVRSLGPGHGKLLTELRGFPPGAEALALRVLHIFTEHGRPGAPLVALVKGLVAERELDVRFLMPIIAEMDKVRGRRGEGGRGGRLSARAGGDHASPAQGRRHARRERGEQGARARRVRLGRRAPRGDARGDDVEPAARAAERAAHTRRADGLPPRVGQGHRAQADDRGCAASVRAPGARVLTAAAQR